MLKLPKRFPENSKYVVEACGPRVRRYVELPGGRRMHLRSRKAKPCICAERSTSIVDKDITNSPTFDRQFFTYFRIAGWAFNTREFFRALTNSSFQALWIMSGMSVQEAH